MPDVQEDAELSTRGAPRIAINVGKCRSGLRVLNWVLENEVPANGMLYLIHVELPLRRVPNALGGKFPIEQVHPEMVKRHKIHRFLKTQKLLDQYRGICDKKKVQTKVCYSESDSVQKELVSQILKFGITKLVIGISSQSALSRALKKDSISTFVVKNSPDFCTVMVVNKGSLCLVKHATRANTTQCSPPCSENDSRMSRVSETTSEGDDAFEDDSWKSIDMQDGERITWSGILDDISSSQRDSIDFSQTSSQWARSYGKCNNGPYYSPAVGVIITELPDSKNALLNDRCEPQTTLLTEGSLSEDKLLNSIGMVHEVGSICKALDRRQDSDSSMLGDMAASIISDKFVPQALLPIDNGHLIDPSLVASDCAVELLQNQLMEARLCTERSQRQAEEQRRKFDAILAKADKKVVEALRSAKSAMQQSVHDTNRADMAIRDHEELNKRLAEEVSKHRETQLELATQKRMLDVYAQEAASAKDHAETERRRSAETLVKLEEMTRNVEKEYQLRREAEEIASQEAFAKRTALAALRKEQQGYYEYSFQELQSATMNFSEENKIGEGAYGPVYRGKLHHTTVAIKVLAQDRLHGCREFQKEVELLSCIHHPHILMLLGACHESQCIVCEYMANGSLEDCLNCKNGSPPLPWYIRLRICLEVTRALLFLKSQPKPIVYCGLKLANILLDNNFVSKIGVGGLARILPPFYNASKPAETLDYADPDYQHTGVESCECDVYALGIIMLQLLTGRPATGITKLVEEANKNGKLVDVFDYSAGDWPLEEALKLARISLQCTTVRRERANLEIDILPVLESIQAVTGVASVDMTCIRPSSSSTRCIIPSAFFCPIVKEIMDDPCIAADGFTYEHHAIRVWLQANNTSPMTNLRLDCKKLIPNYAMRSAIKGWRDKVSVCI